MANLASFDISTGADLQEVDNAVNQATKEVIQRYDFKGSKASIAFDRAKAVLTLVADDDFKMKALFDVLQGKLIKRGVPVKNLALGEITPAAGDTVRREITLTQGIAQEKAKAIVKAIKDRSSRRRRHRSRARDPRSRLPKTSQEVMAFCGPRLRIELVRELPRMKLGVISPAATRQRWTRAVGGELWATAPSSRPTCRLPTSCSSTPAVHRRRQTGIHQRHPPGRETQRRAT
jgi:uncharacterized protein YajQ (UPF0234 family)